MALPERVSQILRNIMDMRAEFESGIEEIAAYQDNEEEDPGDLADICNELQPHVDQWSAHLKELIEILED